MNAATGAESTHATVAALPTFVSLPNDPTGIDTFERYRWQTKVAVLHGLAVLGPTGPVAVVAEMLEDLVIVETDIFRFAQLKTRDRGSWSATKICSKDHAVSKLVASYLAAKASGLLELSQFEVWLEGPAAEDSKTKKFFARPLDAHADLKAKVRDMGLKARDLTDFLSRLRIHPGQPSRQSIDAVVLKAIGATWPHLQYQQQRELYDRLLQVAAAAQSATEPPAVVRSAISAGRLNPSDLDGWVSISPQVMLRSHLIAICPPLSSATNEELLERAASGETTLLELKLTRAGATPETVANAIGARAEADIIATLAVSGGTADAEDVQMLSDRILGMADSVAALGNLEGVAAPAEHVFHNLMSRPADVSSIDTAKVFSGDHRLIVGYLCGLSDQCRFCWGAL